MSRRHHGRSHQGGRYRHEPPRPAPGAAPTTPPVSTDAATDAPRATPDEPLAPAPSGLPEQTDADVAATREPSADAVAANAPSAHAVAANAPSGPPAGFPRPQGDGRPSPASASSQANGHAIAPGQALGPANGQDRSIGCTAPQLRRFIKSRPYVPMHELRRRFAIDGGDDDVTQVAMHQGHIYVGLPYREGALLGELLRGGDIGYELSLDPRTPVVIGVYPMRPVPRA